MAMMSTQLGYGGSYNVLPYLDSLTETTCREFYKQFLSFKARRKPTDPVYPVSACLNPEIPPLLLAQNPGLDDVVFQDDPDRQHTADEAWLDALFFDFAIFKFTGPSYKQAIQQCSMKAYSVHPGLPQELFTYFSDLSWIDRRADVPPLASRPQIPKKTRIDLLIAGLRRRPDSLRSLVKDRVAYEREAKKECVLFPVPEANSGAGGTETEDGNISGLRPSRPQTEVTFAEVKLYAHECLQKLRQVGEMYQVLTAPDRKSQRTTPPPRTASASQNGRLVVRRSGDGGVESTCSGPTGQYQSSPSRPRAPNTGRPSLGAGGAGSPRPPLQGSDRPRTCHNCGEAGHLARECSKPPRARDFGLRDTANRGENRQPYGRSVRTTEDNNGDTSAINTISNDASDLDVPLEEINELLEQFGFEATLDHIDNDAAAFMLTIPELAVDDQVSTELEHSVVPYLGHQNQKGSNDS